MVRKPALSRQQPPRRVRLGQYHRRPARGNPGRRSGVHVRQNFVRTGRVLRQAPASKPRISSWPPTSARLRIGGPTTNARWRGRPACGSRRSTRGCPDLKIAVKGLPNWFDATPRSECGERPREPAHRSLAARPGTSGSLSHRYVRHPAHRALAARRIRSHPARLQCRGRPLPDLCRQTVARRHARGPSGSRRQLERRGGHAH